MTFDSWFRRHLADEDPHPEPASPPPFTPGARVIASVAVLNAPLALRRGEVVAVDFTTDDDNPYGPWVITVLLDVYKTRMVFHAAELTREPKPLNTPADIAAAFGVPESVLVEPPMPHDDDYEPYTPVGEVPADSLAPWLQRAKELRHETVFADTPVYDDVVASAMAADGLAAEVSAYLAAYVEGGAA